MNKDIHKERKFDLREKMQETTTSKYKEMQLLAMRNRVCSLMHCYEEPEFSEYKNSLDVSRTKTKIK